MEDICLLMARINVIYSDNTHELAMYRAQLDDAFEHLIECCAANEKADENILEYLEALAKAADNRNKRFILDSEFIKQVNKDS
jgi:hypothetical protein